MLTLTLAALPLLALAPSQDPRIVDRDAELIVRPDCADSLVDQTDPQSCLQASSTPTLGMLYPLSTAFFVDTFGQVGIGTTSPFYPLHVRADNSIASVQVTNTGAGAAIFGCATGLTNVSSDSGVGVWGLTGSPSAAGVRGQAIQDAWYGVEGRSSSAVAGAAGVFGRLSVSSPGAFSAGVRGENEGTGGQGVGVYGQHSGDGYGVYGRADGGGGFGLVGDGGSTGVFGAGADYGVYSFGDLGAAGVKSFVQPHPTDSAREIRFVCLEGNESGTYFRGSSRLVNGRVTIEVPEEFRLVSETDGLTVQLTPVGSLARMCVDSVDLERIVVRGDLDCEFHYFVNGVRRGFADFETLRPNTSFVPRFRDEPYAENLPTAVRDLMVGNGLLNADYTPNETTAVRNGWKLNDPAPRKATPPRNVNRR